jgi:hypothetical protein
LSSKLRPKAADVEYRVESLSGAGGKSATVVSVSNELDRRQLHVDRLKRIVREPVELFGEPVQAVAAEQPTSLGADEFEVERVLDRRKRGSNISYLIRWRGYGPQDDSWVNETDLKANDKVREYERHLADRELAAKTSPLSYADVVKKGTPTVAATPRKNPPRATKKSTSSSLH